MIVNIKHILWLCCLCEAASATGKFSVSRSSSVCPLSPRLICLYHLVSVVLWSSLNLWFLWCLYSSADLQNIEDGLYSTQFRFISNQHHKLQLSPWTVVRIQHALSPKLPKTHLTVEKRNNVRENCTKTLTNSVPPLPVIGVGVCK